MPELQNNNRLLQKICIVSSIKDSATVSKIMAKAIHVLLKVLRKHFKNLELLSICILEY